MRDTGNPSASHILTFSNAGSGVVKKRRVFPVPGIADAGEARAGRKELKKGADALEKQTQNASAEMSLHIAA